MDRNIKLSKDQQHAMLILTSGTNTFLTGKAGTGKSFLLEYFIDYSRSAGKEVIVTAYTGIAAQNVHGVTINRAFKLDTNPKLYLPQEDKIPPILRSADIIIIDEISMCRIDLFEYLMNLISLAQKKFGRRIQVVVVGDFYQLPPVLPDEEIDDLTAYYKGELGKGYAFQSELWYKMGFRFIELKDVMRQDNIDFVKALDLIRMGDPRGAAYIKSHSSPKAFANACSLVATKAEAEKINQKLLESLDPSTEHVYVWRYSGDVKKSDIRAEKKLTLRLGAQVMVLINDTSGQNLYVNGTYATVVALYDDSVIVKLASGTQVQFRPYMWETYNYKQTKIDSDIFSVFILTFLKLFN